MQAPNLAALLRRQKEEDLAPPSHHLIQSTRSTRFQATSMIFFFYKACRFLQDLPLFILLLLPKATNSFLNPFKHERRSTLCSRAAPIDIVLQIRQFCGTKPTVFRIWHLQRCSRGWILAKVSKLYLPLLKSPALLAVEPGTFLYSAIFSL